MSALTSIQIPGIDVSYKGKVRDVYDLGDTLILVATDRLSAFDVVFDEGIPEKGKILTSISNHWFESFSEIKNHLITTDVLQFPEPFNKYVELLEGRAVHVKKTARIDYECVVRNYLMGSASAEYEESGTVCGVPLPAGLRPGDKLSAPIFTPATKVDDGHDMNVPFEYMINDIGQELALKLKNAAIELFSRAAHLLEKKGIILFDTKLEFGLLNGELILIDEIFTPDSSRFGEKEIYDQNPGGPVITMDKQIIRDYLNQISWNRKPPAPRLPPEIIEMTRKKYLEVQEIVECITK